MRRLCAFLMFAFWFVPRLSAKPPEDWNHVEKIRWDTPVRVEIWSGEEVVGRFQSATDTAIQLKVRDSKQHGLTVRRDLAREDVHVVEQLGRQHQDPYKLMGSAQIIGGVSGAIAVGVLAGKAWPIGVLAGGAAGALAGTMLGGTAAIVSETRSRQHKVVYQAPSHPATASDAVLMPVF